MDKLAKLLQSRKFWATVVGLGVVVLGPRGGLTADEVFKAVVILVTYITGTALEDGLRK